MDAKTERQVISTVSSRGACASSTAEKPLGTDDSARPLPSDCTLADLADRCPTCLVTMEWMHSHYQCPRCGWRDSCCM